MLLHERGAMVSSRDIKDCKKTFASIEVILYCCNSLYSGTVKNISGNCICLNSNFCFPSNSMFELLVPFQRKFMDIPVRVSRFAHIDTLFDTMSVEVLSPSKEYTDFVENFTLNH
jgi:hypothetical protein